MSAAIEVCINTNKIPKNVGHLIPFGEKQSLHINSMTALREWVADQIIKHEGPTVYVVSGAMPNCCAMQIGVLLSGKGDVIFKTTRDFRRKMELI